MTDLVQTAQDLIARDEIGPAIEAIRKATERTDRADTAIIFSQRFHELEREQTQGTLTAEEVGVRKRVLGRDLLGAVQRWAREERGEETPATVARTQARMDGATESALQSLVVPELLRLLSPLVLQNVGQLSLAPAPPLFAPPLPTPQGIARPAVQRAFTQALTAHALVIVKGSSGSGRTQAAVQVATPQHSTWVRLRSLKVEEAAQRVVQAVHHATQQRHSLLVLDDLPRMTAGDALCEQFLALRAQPFRTLGTTAEEFPDRLRRDLGDALSILPLPPFSDEEASALLELAGAPASELAPKRLSFFKSLTSNHPELLRVLVDYLRRRSWKYDDETVQALLSRSFAAGAQQDALRYLKESVTDEAARRLLYRLDLVLGTIRREQVDAVAAADPDIATPYEKLDEVRGNWVRDEAPDSWVLSPMITGVGRRQLTARETERVHALLAEVILRRSSLNAEDLTNAVIHLEGANDERAGSLLAMGLSSFVYDAPEGARRPLFVSLFRDVALPTKFSVGSKALIRAFHLRLDDQEGRNGTRALTELVELVRDGSNHPSLSPLDAIGLFAAAISAGPLRAQTNGRTSVELARKMLHLTEKLPSTVNIAAPDVQKMLRAVFWLCGAQVKEIDELGAWTALLREIPREHLFPLSDIAEEGAFSFPRFIVVREADRKHADWAALDEALQALEETAANREIPLLAANACAARVMMYAEYRGDLLRAREIAAKGLERYGAARGCEWSLREALGIQLADARADDDAVRELERVVQLKVLPFGSVYRARATLRLSKLLRTRAPARSLMIARQAIAYVQSENRLPPTELVRALGELAIALAEVEGTRASFDAWSEAADTLLGAKLETDMDRGLFSVFGHALGYFTSLAVRNAPPEAVLDGGEYTKPEAGFFLTDTSRAAQSFQPERKAFLPAQLEMFAQAVGRSDAVLIWGERATRALDESGDRSTRGLLVQTVLPFYLSRLAFEKAAETALAAGEMIAARPVPPGAVPAVERKDWFMRENLLLPAFLTAATLRLNGAPDADDFAQQFLAFCRNRAQVSRQSSWTLASDVIEAALMSPVGRQIPQNPSDETGLESVRRLSLTLPADCTPIRALQEQLPVFQHFFTSGRSNLPMAQLVVFPFVLAYWRQQFQRARFQFTPPRLMEETLQTAPGEAGENGVRSIFATVVRSLSVTPPAFVLAWLRAERR